MIRLLVETMTLKEWYWSLVERYVTMVVEPGMERCYIPSRAEVASPNTDWEETWHLARIPGLSSDLTTFLWRLLHRLLPTQERLHHITPASTTNLCKACIIRGQDGDVDSGETGTLQHELMNCGQNDGAGDSLLKVLRLQIPGLTADKVLRLEFGEANYEIKIAMTFSTAAVL